MPLDPANPGAPANAPSITLLKQQRSSTKGSLTRIRNIISAENQLLYIELECRLDMIESYYKQAMYYQSKIEEYDPTDMGRAEIDELYVSTKSKVRLLIEQRKPKDGGVCDQSFTLTAPIQSRLPTLKLPRFDGNYLDNNNFDHTFKTLVHSDTTLSKIEKFNHLLSCLSGEALATVKAYQVTDNNYDLAIARLKERYDNVTLIFLRNVSELFEVSAINKPDAKQLRAVVDTISALYNSLKALDTPDKILDVMLIHLIMTKVDAGTKQRWEEQLTYTTLPTWSRCCTMLDNRCQQLEARGKRNDGSQLSHPNNKNNKGKSSQYSLLANSTTDELNQTKMMCHFCEKGTHKIMSYKYFLMLPAAEKVQKIEQKRLCKNCLGKGHAASECSSRRSCDICKRRHHSFLHEGIAASERATSNHSALVSEFTSTPASTHATFTTATSLQAKSSVVLATASVLIQDALGCFHTCRVLLDSLSQLNFVTTSLARKLKLKTSKTSVDVYGVGDISTTIKHQTQTKIRSRLTNFEMTIECLVSDKITGYHPDEAMETDQLKLPTTIKLADPKFHLSKGIDALLGTEVFFSALSAGKIKLGDKLPILVETDFGWIVTGRYDPSAKTTVIGRSLFTASNDINSNIERLWKYEDIVTQPTTCTAEQEMCESHFTKNVQLNEQNRIMVRLPFKSSPHALGNSRDIASQRFRWLERKLSKNPTLKNDYAMFLKEYERLGHMSLVTNPDLRQLHYFIPHHCVLKPTSESTKLRVVFDASCRSASQISLNDILMVGPTIQNELFITLLRFRSHQYGLMADISKMYRQVLVHPDDRRYQYILWREDESHPVSTYMLNTVTYGTAAAPFLAIRSLQYAAESYPHPHTLGRHVIKNDFYVDDMLTGADNFHTLQKIKHEITEVLQHYNLDLCKWHCSHPKFKARSERELQLDEEVTSALGVKWMPDNDEFVFYFQPKKPMTTFTKRSILSFTSSFFDPLGLLNPLIVVPRILLQQLWIQNLSWGEPVPPRLERKFIEFIDDLKNLSILKIPRFVRISNMTKAEIHGFCDASSKAYGCCLYVRCTDLSGNIAVNLLTSKVRLAPIKTCTLPRLELCSAHLLAKLWAKVQPFMSYHISAVHFWSDSQVALHWIGSEPATLSVFVGNRVSDIQNLTPYAKWHHVNSSNNPADLISRGCLVRMLQTSMWVHGPNFLQQEPCEWPLISTPTLTSNQLALEQRKTCFINQQRPEPYIIKQIHKYSDHVKCLRIFSYILRVQSSKDTDNNNLSAVELKNALHHIVWAIQRHHFAKEITLLKHNKNIKGSMANLSPFLDTAKGLSLLLVGGRLNNANIPFETKHPLLLPKDDPFVESLVIHIHHKNYHAGPKALVSLIQQEFWITNCKSLANKIVHNCVHCARYKPKLLEQVMANLPRERVTECIPFNVTGVDFAGPIPTYLKLRGKIPYKSYIAVFVCFTSKAVHLEAVTELSSDAFIAALKRFVGRRGLPSKIVCDNATNFVGADNKLKEFRSFFNQQSTIDNITRHCTNSFIEFSFIPPRAPHFGGLWEAAVKIAKSHLYRTLSNARLTFEELNTALVEIEAIMNSRPLTSLSTNANDFSALTPAHLMLGKHLKSIPEHINVNKEIPFFERWKRITAIKMHFWQRWKSEYLCELQRRYRWQHPTRNLQVNDLVTIHDDNLPPMK